MFCSNCGNKLDEGSLFCGKCGTKAGEAKAPTVEKKDSKDLASLIIGICSLLLGALLNILMLPVSIVGLILGISSKQKGAKKVVGIILNILGIIIELAIIALVVFGIFFYKSSVTEIEDSHIDFPYGDYIENWG